MLRYKNLIVILSVLLLAGCGGYSYYEHTTSTEEMAEDYYPLYGHGDSGYEPEYTKGVYKPFTTDNVVPYEYGDNDAYFMEYDAGFY